MSMSEPAEVRVEAEHYLQLVRESQMWNSLILAVSGDKRDAAVQVQRCLCRYMGKAEVIPRLESHLEVFLAESLEGLVEDRT